MTAPTNGSTTQVICPECGTQAIVSSGGRAATDFCPTCDYPLFWAASSTVRTTAVTTDEALKRSPGTSGTSAPSAIACPACGERNPPSADLCLRCGADLHPAPPPPPEPPAAPEPVIVVPPPTIVECDHWPSWAVAILSATVTALVAIVALLIWG